VRRAFRQLLLHTWCCGSGAQHHVAPAPKLRMLCLHLQCENDTLSPEAVLATPLAELRASGLSGQKTAYITDLAAHYADGRITDAALAGEPCMCLWRGQPKIIPSCTERLQACKVAMCRHDRGRAHSGADKRQGHRAVDRRHVHDVLCGPPGRAAGGRSRRAQGLPDPVLAQGKLPPSSVAEPSDTGQL